MKVRIYNYSTNQTSEYLLGNYSYDQGGYHSSATFIGGSSAIAHTVRFGNQDGVDCVWIGETNTSWSYPVVSVIDFTSGFRSSDADSQSRNWNIAVVASFGTVQTTITPEIRLSNTYAPTFRADTDMRAPIFYDSNDTNFYGDFASTSVVNAIRFGNSSNNGTLSSPSDWGMRLTTDAGYIQFGPANSSYAHIYTDRDYFYFNKALLINGSTVITAATIGSQTVATAGSLTRFATWCCRSHSRETSCR
jgi:hypothetical protein